MNALYHAIRQNPDGFQLVRFWNTRGFTLEGKRERHQNARHTIQQNTRSWPKGNGNKAWKRADRLEREFRRSGGFYVSDYITPGE